MVVSLRDGSAGDADAVVAMHRRCSVDTLRRRYHAPVVRVSARFARALLAPQEGRSIVAVADEGIVGLGMLSSLSTGAEIAVLVEDRWQRRGVGTRLLRALADEAAARGAGRVLCVADPDNTAALATVRRAGLQARVTLTDGVAEYRIPLLRKAEAARRSPNRPTMGQVTTPLVSLLHGRAELRGVHPAADLIDQAVRGGA